LTSGDGFVEMVWHRDTKSGERDKSGKKTRERHFEAGRAILRVRVYQKRRFDVKKYSEK
jgi:hypothetical protein